MPLCFAYGSNMDRAAMAARCPGARTLGLARLERHRIAIMREGYLTVAPDPRRTVHGLLWDVPLAAMPALDRYEEVGRGLYAKRHVTVLTGAGGRRRALVYLGARSGAGLPRPGYLEGVLDAARAEGLPEAAIAAIGALSGRRARHQAGSASPRPSGSRSAWPWGTNSSDTELMQ